MSAQSQDRNTQDLVIHVGTQAASVVLPASILSRKVLIKQVSLLNGAAVAASDTNYVQVSLKNGSTVIAELDSRAAHEDGLASLTKEALNLVAAQLTQVKNSVLSVDIVAAGTVTLTNAKLIIQVVPVGSAD